jgi:hypothetical protein
MVFFFASRRVMAADYKIHAFALLVSPYKTLRG